MKGIADLHIHSRYSRATSKQGTPEYLDLWARKKGISILGTGDFTHPAWREELKEKLVPAEEGLYCLKKDFLMEESCFYRNQAPRFVLSGEISSIYKKNGKVRKVHNVILLPGLEDAEKLSKKLETIGNIHSDGRPILGLGSHDLLEILLDICPEGILIPAHIWTPHFSMFGAFSGFDTVEECFEDLAPYVHAVETGLSSDPPMNWQLSALDRFQLISNSDAHSPAKLGREANLFDIELSYQGLYHAIQEGKGLEGTIEFYPEEGKYHYDGHRKCHLCLSPKEAEKYGGICPVCGKKLTVGVDHRVLQLSDREDGRERKEKKPFEYLVPLPEVIASSTGKTPASKKVQAQYEAMLKELGTEFEILREIPIEEIKKQAGYLTAEGIRRLRADQVIRKPGYDGEYGTIQLFEPEEIETPTGQISFLSAGEMHPEKQKERNILPKDISAVCGENTNPVPSEVFVLNEMQKKAVETPGRRIAVVAGPGTGKTKTLVSRILYLLEHRKVSPGEITAVTFTNQAAEELKARLEKALHSKRGISRMHIGTFHSVCLDFLKKQGREISLIKAGNGSAAKDLPKDIFTEYESRIKEQKLYDFDDLLLETIRFFQEAHNQKNRKKQSFEKPFSYLLVDEFQDISPMQYELIREWNKNGKELFVIGDPDQSIYGFRGSDSACFSRLQEEFPETEMVFLENNYRSTAPILKGALSVIRHNPGINRNLIPQKKEGTPIRIAEASSITSQSVFIAKEINRMVGGLDMLDAETYFAKEGKEAKRSFRDIAVLYRTHYQARTLEKCFQKEGIPYIVHGREEFLSDPVVQGTICFFSSLANPENPTYKQECIKKLWNLDETELAESIYEKMISIYAEKWNHGKPAKILKEWTEDLDLKENDSLNKLGDMAVFYPNMKEFLDALLLGEENDLKRCKEKKIAGDAVSLMTLHGSKGLEFPVVFLYGAEKGELPLERKGEEADVFEERRLFYVGMTRAREELILTFTGEPSVFLKEIPEEVIKKEKTGKQKTSEIGKQLSLFDLLSEPQ